MARPGPLLAVAALLALALAARGPANQPETGAPAPVPARESSCVACHAGIEPMHPQAELSCTDCHGGDSNAASAQAAHVQPARAAAGDERVAALDDDLAWRRFVNPMDLRVAETTCGGCHADEVARVHTSLHASTAGHLSDGFYEVGLLPKKGSKFSIFPLRSSTAGPGELSSLEQVPSFNERLPRDKLSTHFMDLTRKECAQCHLWSNGRAVRGRVGFDGDYRGSGCAACHVAYALDGRSASADAQAVRNEPGHPLRHVMTRAPTTQSCSACHNGDASIGLSFQGLSQLPPGAPGGPEIAGTTDALRHRAFYIDDPAVTPPDVHHERGMHCIDCHTENDVMGDGRLHGSMEHAVEIACQDCHGSFEAPATLITQRGTRLRNLSRDEHGVWLTSKQDGARHRVLQVVDVLNPEHADYNERATKAMTSVHGKLECYACHASWNVNFLGFHFDRNESLTQLDLLSGKRTSGRVTTQEKLFTTWKSFYAGFNESGRVAPYLTGFSTMGTVRDKDGKLLLDQQLPVTASGLSGMTMIHHQVHTTRSTARACVECHRSSATWGLGSANFRLSRRLAFVADRRGVEVVALDRAQLASSMPLAKAVVPRVVALAVDSDPLQGHARFVYAAEREHGVHVIDVSDPTAPRRVGFAASVAPQALSLCGDVLLCADGAGGLRLFDVSTPSKIRLLSVLPTLDARALAVQWPFVYVADGPGGLLIADVRAPLAPVLAGGLALDWKGRPDESLSVAVLFQYSRPTVFAGRPADDRTQARLLCAVLDARRGMELVDVTEASAPIKLWPQRWTEEEGARRGRGREDTLWRSLALRTHVDLGQAQGGAPTRERDVVYALGQRDENGNAVSRLTVFDVSDPTDAHVVSAADIGFDTRALEMIHVYQPPFLSTLALVPDGRGLFAGDASISEEFKSLGALAGLSSTSAIAFEEFALDRSISEQGERLKDVSHRESRWLNLPEIERLLSVESGDFGLPTRVLEAELPSATARLHLARLDLDRSGFLEGAEFERGGGAGVDRDGDQRLSLAELLASAAAGEQREAPTAAPEAPPEPAMGAERRALSPAHAADGELACLLDTIRPAAFDASGDARLDPAEFSRALFAALDLDASRQLDLAELSRLPGETRQLRFGGAPAAARFALHDKNGDGLIAAKEWKLGAEQFAALDHDKDGALRLAPRLDPLKGRRSDEGPNEWPSRQPIVNSLPPVLTRETVLGFFDSDGDGILSTKELKSRPDILAEGDDTNDGRLEPIELKSDLDRIDSQGVDATLDGFLERWDLDRDGKVSPRELPLWSRP